ncbi:MAG: hypothetical protein M3Y84_03965 [Acidobacteriota bacterium]|nr:hypothetical protein [Acidobacteriota bacterium]
MPVSPTEQEFSQYLNTKFHVQLEAGPQIELELVEVKGYLNKPHEQRGMERFSLFFSGPRDPHLPQGTYTLVREQTDKFEIFLVPIAQNEHGFRYEAVFNYFK